MMTKISKDVAEKISHFPATTKKAAVLAINEGKDVDEVIESLKLFAEVEKNVYIRWQNQMYREMSDLRIDKESYAYELYQILKKDISTLRDVAKKAKKRVDEQMRLGQKPGRMIQQFKRLIDDYLERCKSFGKYASVYVVNQDLEGLTRVIAENEERYRRNNEDKLFLLQLIKHVRHLQKHDLPIPPELYKLALDTSFCMDEKIMSEQVLMVYYTWDYGLANSLMIKQMSYDYAKHVLTKVVANANLIEYLFKGDWVSRETHDLLMEAYDNIKKFGMHSLVYAKAIKLYEQGGLANRQAEKMGISDKMVSSLVKKFSL